ncbi:MAG: NAD(P)/FAD-dependent oxidoreductase [Candidatus Lernaella stagnicola]|nr:NAD(P)/FAD-dependent oxidoreductase [Candidatus Lernaella stagnicola]
MSPTIAIIGGGPAGATCAWHLARAGVRTLLYERDVEREKPCGGGLTERAFTAVPMLAEVDLDWNEVGTWRMVVGDREVAVELERPLRVVSRRDLDGVLRREAVKAGAALVEEPVRELARMGGGGWQVNDHMADILVGAGGMKCPLAAHLGLELPKEETAVALGRFIPGTFAPEIVTAFFPAQQSYAWFFPRRDHASLGLVMPGASFNTEAAKEMMTDFAVRHLPEFNWDDMTPFGWTGPAVRDWSSARRRFAGEDWFLVGDAAGLCDVTTGEGVPYALASGALAADAILAGDPATYEWRVRLELVPDLEKSSHLQPKFFRGWMLRAALRALGRSGTCRRIASELAHGEQDYLTLRDRVYRNGWRIAREFVTGRV